MCIEDSVRPVYLNIVATEEHVVEIERPTMTVKESTRYHVHRCMCERYPRIMIIGCVVKITKYFN